MNSYSLFSLLIVLSFFNNTVFSQQKYPIDQGEVLFESYDPVSYFNGKPLKGSKEHSINHEGRAIFFITKENKDKFALNPEKYAPAYGGWCAISMSGGNFVYPDYTNYLVQNNRLFFFVTKAFYNGKTAWEKDSKSNEQLADSFYFKAFPN